MLGFWESWTRTVIMLSILMLTLWHLDVYSPRVMDWKKERWEGCRNENET